MTVEDFLPYELIYQDLIFEPTVMNSSTLDQEKRSAVLINIEVNLVTPSLCGINSCASYIKLKLIKIRATRAAIRAGVSCA